MAMPRGANPFSVLVALAVTSLVVACGGAGTSAVASHTIAGRSSAWGPLPFDGDPSAQSSAHVTFTPNTVAVSAARIQSSLVGLSPDGSTYTFSGDASPLSNLAPGKVMLLEGLDAAVVTGVQHSGNNLVVTTTPASLPQLIESGTIDVNAPPDTGNAFASEVAPLPGTSPDDGATPSASPATTSLVLPGRRPAARAGGGIQLDGFSGNGFSKTGQSNGYKYSVTLGGSTAGITLNGTFCYTGTGSANCNTGLSIQGTITGLLSYTTETANLVMAGGALKSGKFTLQGLSATLTVKYIAVRAVGAPVGASPPTFDIPFAYEMPVCPATCGGVPLYTKVQLNFFVKLGISAQNSTMGGGLQATLGGSGSVSTPGSVTVLGSGSGYHINGNFIPETSITLGASAIEIGLQLKVGIGLGIRALNGLFYVSAIVSIGQVTGSAVAGMFCSKYLASFFITGNAEAQVFIFHFSSPAVTLYKKTASYTQPGCSSA
jgi:hypothetical protein